MVDVKSIKAASHSANSTLQREDGLQMRILMVTPYYHPIIGGTESLVENISIKLNEHGVHTDVMTFNYDMNLKTAWNEKSESINGVNVIRMPVIRVPRPTFFINHLTACMKFRRKLKQYDIIHFHNDTDLSFPLFAYKENKPKVFHCHCLDTTYYYYRVNPVIRQILKNSADIFIVLSKFFSEQLVNLGLPKAKIRILPNSVDIKRFKEGNEEKIENLVLFVGRLEQKKGIPILLKSLRYLKTRIKLVIIGPPSAYQNYSNKIVKLINDVSSKTIHTVTYLGKVKLEELIRWYQKASIVVVPSFFESFPMVNIESLACGTPVIASNVGAVPEVVRNYQNGILIPPGDPIKLAEGIQYLLDNEEIRLKFGKEGRKFIVENFSSEVIIARLIKIYRSLL